MESTVCYGVIVVASTWRVVVAAGVTCFTWRVSASGQLLVPSVLVLVVVYIEGDRPAY